MVVMRVHCCCLRCVRFGSMYLLSAFADKIGKEVRLMKLLFRIRKPLILLLCAALLIALCACSLDNVTENEKKTAAGQAFLSLEDPKMIQYVSVAYTSVMDESNTEILRNQEHIADLCAALTEAVGDQKSVEWSEITDAVDGGEGYCFTLKFKDGTSADLSFVCNPTKGYLCLKREGAGSLYYQVGEEALQTLASFYPA